MDISRHTVRRWEGGKYKEPISPQNDYIFRGQTAQLLLVDVAQYKEMIGKMLEGVRKQKSPKKTPTYFVDVAASAAAA